MNDSKSPGKRQRTARTTSSTQKTDSASQQQEKLPRIRKIIIRNFRCIESVEVVLDKIVILVGANNTGKSAVLRAYEIALRSNEKVAELDIEDFPFHVIPENMNLCPQIIIETSVSPSAKIDQKWKRYDDKAEEEYITEKWTWNSPGKGQRIGWDNEINGWAERETDRVPIGWESVADAYRPEPLRLSPFDSPEKIQENVIKLLRARIKEQVAQSDRNSLSQMIELCKNLNASISSETRDMLDKMTNSIQRVFPGHLAKLDSPHADHITKNILELLVKMEPILYMGTEEHQSPLGKQGSGAQRMLMWAALKCTAEQKVAQKGKESSSRSFSLLIDEPELCLHPSAVREASSLLYEIAALPNWQVMITTHSPVFINLESDNTSIVRVDRELSAKSSRGTTIYRPTEVRFDPEQRENLKLLTMCDPYVAEFFFAKQIILVEGDTEYVVLRRIITDLAKDSEGYRDIHILRARGKANIASFCKILNHFTKPYAILHDSDNPKDRSGRVNGRWTDNAIIREGMKPGTRIVAMVTNFETAFLSDKNSDKEKPFQAFQAVGRDSDLESRIRLLLDYLLGYGEEVPNYCCKGAKMATLEQAHKDWTTTAEHLPPLISSESRN